MKINKLLSVAAVTAILFLSCTQKETGSVAEISLSGVDVAEPTAYLGGFPIMFSGDTLIEQTSYTDSLFTMSTLCGDSLNVIANFGKKGNGPFELTKGNIVKKSDGSLLIIDTSAGFISNIYEVAADALHDTDRWTQYKIGAEKCIPYSSAIAIGDSSLLMLSAPILDVTSIMSTLNYKTAQMSPVEFWPEDGYDGPATPKFMAYMTDSHLFKGPGDNYLYHCGNSDLTIIFNIENNRVNIKHLINDKYPEYKAAADGLNYTSDKPADHILQCTANQKHIYILNYGKDATGAPATKPQDIKYGDEVDVYDWDGRLIRKYILDKGGYYIYVNGNDTELFLCTVDPESGEKAFVNYRLPE